MDIEKVVTEILKIRQELAAGNTHGEDLSEKALQLAAYKATLGGYVANVRFQRDDLASKLDHLRAKQYLKHRNNLSIKDAEQNAKIDCQEMQLELNQASYNFERLRNLHNDSHDMLDSIKSRLIHLLQERGETMQPQGSSHDTIRPAAQRGT